jgi:hypothetical protein
MARSPTHTDELYHSQSQSPPRMSQASLLKLTLNNGWQFHQADKDTWYSATVPGSVLPISTKQSHRRSVLPRQRTETAMDREN